MLNIFKRLSRLARSELNSLADKIRSTCESDEATNETEEALQDEIDAATEGNEWPKEIREAYASLELPLGSDEDAVKRAYRELTKHYHPDKHHGDAIRTETAAELTQRIREAYERVIDFLEQREKRKGS